MKLAIVSLLCLCLTSVHSQNRIAGMNNSAHFQNNRDHLKQESMDSLCRGINFSKKQTGYSIFMNSQEIKIRDNSTGEVHTYSTKDETTYRKIIDEIRSGKKVVEFNRE